MIELAFTALFTFCTFNQTSGAWACQTIEKGTPVFAESEQQCVEQESVTLMTILSVQNQVAMQSQTGNIAAPVLVSCQVQGSES